MKHDIRVTFHTDGHPPDSGRLFVESAINKHPGAGAINKLKVEHHHDLVEVLRRALPFVEEICEADAVGARDDNCGVRRAEAVRDEIYSILHNPKSIREPKERSDDVSCMRCPVSEINLS